MFNRVAIETRSNMADEYLNFDEYIQQGEPSADEGGLKGQQAVSPRQRIGISVSPRQRLGILTNPWQINITRIITAPKGHKHQEYGTITL